jgi:hypothetical protein
MALIEEHLKQDYDEGARLAAMMTESWQNLGRIA